MMFYNPNRFLHPQDPAYDHNFDEEAAYDAYCDACEAREEARREDN